MATINYPGISLTDAFSTLFGELAGIAPTIQTGTLGIAWSTTAAAGQAGFILTGKWGSPLATNTLNIQAADLTDKEDLPISYAGRGSACSRQLNFARSTATADAAEIMTQVVAATAQMLEDSFAATIVSSATESITLTGFSRPGHAVGRIIFTNGIDAGMIVHWIVDELATLWSSSSAIPTLIPNSTGATLYSGSSVTVQDVSEPLDMDIAINNGANIFSVVSRTFTEPGP
jgi:hypothetical protein